MAVPIEELGEKLKKYLKEGRRVTFLGDGVPVHKTKIKEEILPGEAVTFAPANMNRQRAASVGTLGMQYYKECIDFSVIIQKVPILQLCSGW